MKAIVFCLMVFLFLLAGCSQNDSQSAQTSSDYNNSLDRENDAANPIPETIPVREDRIPANAVKITPETDAAPPKSISSEYQDPIPLQYPINTAGAEDSAFILPDGKTLYFFFTPDVKVPVERQVLDGVTGIYVSKKEGSSWSHPKRILLQEPGKIAGDGCGFVLGNTLWFCSAREGYVGMHWFTAEYRNEKWQNWKNADFNPLYEVGELHMTGNGNELYFHSGRTGGKGKLDIWLSKKVNGEWQEPENVTAANTAEDDGWPGISPNEKELWFSRNYGLWRSKKENGSWQSPELMISPLAGEASLDSEGNVYFTHHFFKENDMIEADIFVAKKK